MDESHPPLEQRPQKEQKQRQNENLQPYHKEREARRWQRKEDWDDLYDVSDDENDHKNNSSTKSKAKPKRSGAGTEETSKDSWPRGLFRGLRLTLGHSKPKAVIGTDNLVEARRPRVVRSMDNLVDAQNPRLRATPFSEFPREENARPSAGSASKLARILPLKPEDIPDNEHPLRQHPMFDASGRIVLHDPPTSTAAMGVIPTPRKAKRLSLVPEREEERAEAPIRDDAYLSANRKHLGPKGKQRARSNPALRSSPLHFLPPLPEDRPPTFFRAKIRVAPFQVGSLPLQPLSFERGEILQFRYSILGDDMMDELMYVLHRRDDPNVFGLVDPEDVELVDDRAWLQWEKKVGRG